MQAVKAQRSALPAVQQQRSVAVMQQRLGFRAQVRQPSKAGSCPVAERRDGGPLHPVAIRRWQASLWHTVVPACVPVRPARPAWQVITRAARFSAPWSRRSPHF